MSADEKRDGTRPGEVPPGESSGDSVEDGISYTLRLGGLASIAIVSLGLVMLIVGGGRTGYPAGGYPRDFGTLLAGLRYLKPYAIIDVGLLILLFTPYVVVAIAARWFARQGNRLYVAVSGFVLFVLLLSAALGKLGE